MSHDHSHTLVTNPCQHPNIKFCQVCRIPYCTDCGYDWAEKCSLPHSNPWTAPYYPPMTVPGTNPMTPYYGTFGTGDLWKGEPPTVVFANNLENKVCISSN